MKHPDTFLERRQSLLDSLGTQTQVRGESWRPEVGDRISGEIVGYGKSSNDYGTQWYVTIHDDETGELRSIYLSTVLWNRFNELHPHPQPGEWIAIQRLEAPSGKNYKNFAFVIDREGFEPGSAEPPFDNAKSRQEQTNEDTPF